MARTFKEWQEYYKDCDIGILIAEITRDNECIESLKKQLEYIRSGEYFNQLRYERNMLEEYLKDYEIPKEDKEFIDMTRRNTELLEIIEKAKDFIKDYKYWLQDSDLVDRKKVDNVNNYILDILEGNIK